MSVTLNLPALLAILVPVALMAVVLAWIRRHHAAQAKHDKWQPALVPQPDVHVLGSDYPQTGRDFLGGMVNNRYTVPKDPIEYAKIFVPETKDKGQAE